MFSSTPVILADWVHHGWGWTGLMMAGWWLVVPAVIAAVVLWARPKRSDARAVLEGRLASGEIDAAEFRERLSVLEES